MNFEQAVDILIDRFEKGFVDDPTDRGGETKYGISKKRYPKEDIKNLTRERAEFLYMRDYWDKLKLSQIQPQLRYFIFDSGVLFGDDDAATWLQQAVGSLPDGIVGPKTIAAANRAHASDVLRLMFVSRALRHAAQNAKQRKRFGAGWYGRLFDVVEISLKV